MQCFRQELRSIREIYKMRKAGLLVYQAHQICASMVKPGVSTGEIDAEVEKFFDAHKAIGCFKGVQLSRLQKPFPSVTCMSLNEEVVHGIPSKDRILREGDILSVDTGCKYNGWCGDSAWTYAVGKIDHVSENLMATTEGVLGLAIELLKVKTHWNEVAAEMEKYVHDNGFSVVECMVGHGIGHEMHEPPQVANYPCRGGNFPIRPGVVIAVEPMVNVGTNALRELSDGWTMITKDRKRSAHFEHTIAITKDGPFVLTAGPDQYDNAKFPEELDE